MNEISFGAQISDKNIDIINNFEALEKCSFNTLVEHFGLDPACDFRHSNLSDIDFSGADIRGFDLTGSNLTGVYGTNIKWDNTTNFTNADTNNSVFSHHINQRLKFGNNPNWKNQYDHLIKQDWSDKIIWFSKEIESNKKHNVKKALTVGYELFENDTDIVVKNNILFFASKAYDIMNLDHRDFLGCEPNSVY